MSGRLAVEWLGRVPYADALDIQAKAVEARRAGTAGDRLLLLEHPPVVTLGRSADPANLLVGREGLARRGIDLYEIPRGGDVTYHAPGQLVGYLVMDLRSRGEPDLHAFLRALEMGLIRALAELGVPARQIPGKTGVFVEPALREDEATSAKPFAERKIASIGVGVRRWITFHGFALNVTVDLAGFDVIVPCGLRGVEMTSVARELAVAPLGLDARVRPVVSEALEREFA